MADVGKVLSKQGRTKADLEEVCSHGHLVNQGYKDLSHLPVAMGPHGSAHDKEAILVAAGAQKVEDLTRFFQ